MTLLSTYTVCLEHVHFSTKNVHVCSTPLSQPFSESHIGPLTSKRMNMLIYLLSLSHLVWCIWRMMAAYTSRLTSDYLNLPWTAFLPKKQKNIFIPFLRNGQSFLDFNTGYNSYCQWQLEWIWIHKLIIIFIHTGFAL